MYKSKWRIIDEIERHFIGKRYQECYIGITSDITKGLFQDHKVSQEYGHWIYLTTKSNKIAREVERYFISTGMDGTMSDGDDFSLIIYAFEKTPETAPCGEGHIGSNHFRAYEKTKLI